MIDTGALSTCSTSTRSASVKPFTACLRGGVHAQERGDGFGDLAADVDQRAALLLAGAAAPTSEPLTTPQKLVSNSRRLSASLDLVEPAVDGRRRRR